MSAPLSKLAEKSLSAPLAVSIDPQATIGGVGILRTIDFEPQINSTLADPSVILRETETANLGASVIHQKRKPAMKKSFPILLWLLVASTMLTPRASAEDGKPFAVASAKSFDGLVQGVIDAAMLVGIPDADKMVMEAIQGFTQGQEIEGLDKDRPWGVTFSVREDVGNAALVFIPATNLEALLALSPVPAEDIGDGVFQVNTGGPMVWLKQKGDWTFAAGKPDVLNQLPEDPAKLLGDLPSKYLIGARVDVQAIPEEMRQQWIGMLTMMSGGGFGPQAGPVPAQVQQLKMWLEETNDLQIGLKVDNDSKSLVLEGTTTAQKETTLASMYGRYGNTTSNFSGFHSPDAPMSMLGMQKGKPTEAEIALLETQREQYKELLSDAIAKERGLPDAAKTIVTTALVKMLDVAIDTVIEGDFDAGAIMVVDPKPTLVVGGKVSDGVALEESVKQLGQLLEGGEGIPEIDWDADTIEGLRVHRLAIPMDGGGDSFLEVVMDDEMEIMLAVDDKRAFLAVGGACEEVLKKVLADSKGGESESRIPMEMSISVEAIVNFLVETGEKLADTPGGPGPMEVQMFNQIAAMMAQHTGKGHIRITSEGITDGIKYQLVIEEGVLKVLQIPIQMAMMQAMGGPGGPGAPGGEFPGEGDFDEEEFGEEDFEDEDF